MTDCIHIHLVRQGHQFLRKPDDTAQTYRCTDCGDLLSVTIKPLEIVVKAKQ